MKQKAKTSAKYVSLVLCVGLLISGVLAGPDGEAKKAYEIGDFERAARRLMENLRKKPDHQDNIALMETVLPLAFKKRMATAKDYAASGDYDRAYIHYEEVKRLADEVSFLPSVMKETKVDGKKQKKPMTFEVVDVTADLAATREQAITKHYQSGLDLEASNSHKSAAVAFRKVTEYDQHYKDASTRYATCREKAIIKVAVMPFDDLSGKPQYGNLGAMVTERVISTAINSNPEFLQFVTRDYLNQLLTEQGMQQTTTIDPGTATTLGQKVGVQAFVFGKVISAIQNYPADLVQSGENTTEQWVAKGDKRTFYVKYQTFTRTGSVSIDASFQIVDVEKGTILSAETVKESATRQAQWVKFQGQEEALPAAVRAHNTTGEMSLDSPEVLANEAAGKLASVLAGRLISKFH